MDVKSRSELPPGFRFHPTDEELIMFYLRNQAMSRPCPVSIIPEVDIYKFDPWELPDKTDFQESDQWYFFTPRDRKYPNGVRPNRASVSGYWKATGTDKAICSGSKYVGVKKALVFYKGRPPKGIKTDWIMHEYRLCDSRTKAKKQNGSMRLDDWVLCRIYKKRHMAKPLEHQNIEDLGTQIVKKTEGCAASAAAAAEDQQQMLKFARTCSLAQLLEMENWGPISQLLSDSTSLNSNSNFDLQNSTPNSGTQNIVVKTQAGEVAYPYADSGKFQLNQSSVFSHQPIFMHPMAYDFQ